jgi:hypothetical protein
MHGLVGWGLNCDRCPTTACSTALAECRQRRCNGSQAGTPAVILLVSSLPPARLSTQSKSSRTPGNATAGEAIRSRQACRPPLQSWPAGSSGATNCSRRSAAMGGSALRCRRKTSPASALGARSPAKPTALPAGRHAPASVRGSARHGPYTPTLARLSCRRVARLP